MLARQLLLKRRSAGAAAETVGLPADRLDERRLSRYERVTDRILHHLVGITGHPSVIEVPMLEFTESPAQQEVEQQKQGENQQESIHSGQ
ncbi:hypothetical protein NITMOv2_0408 [Nitrospira moscoviensis]|uniref:Uncharacterized protein n=1 Tax=Nitrospira moscoviensis TaxID=42253 RepID=A0A0K2G7J0_NITMO|nr:hypothetical protein NITMOv2_0408 [Nitrospira moscoviensis]